MTLDEVFDIAKSKRYLVVSTVNEAGAAEAALMGFALTQAKRSCSTLCRRAAKPSIWGAIPAAALVIGWDDNISLQIEGAARRPVSDDLVSAKEAYLSQWPDGRARENWPNIAYIVVRPKWIRYSNYSGGSRWLRSSRSKRRVRGNSPAPIAPTAFLDGYTRAPMLTLIGVGD